MEKLYLRRDELGLCHASGKRNKLSFVPKKLVDKSVENQRISVDDFVDNLDKFVDKL